MKTLLQAIVALCALAVALPARAAENLILAQTDALCVANQAAPDRVFAAAEAAGWKGIPNEPGGILDLFNMVPSPAIRLKDFDSRHLVLKAKEEALTMPFGPVMRRVCSVAEDVPASSDLTQSLRARFGPQPPVVEGPISSWAWVESSEGRQFLSGQTNEDVARALVDHTVYLLAVAREGEISMVMYYELSRVAP